MKSFLKLFPRIAIILLMIANPLFAQKIIINGIDDDIEKINPKPRNITKEKSKDFECGDIFVDPRDGKSYTTIQIGEQCWMGKNLDFGQMINDNINMTNNGIAEKYCYDNDPANCDTYGALYRWGEAMKYTATEGIQGLCPDGWHIATDAEWCTLEMTVDATINCSSLFWRGTDGGTKLKFGGTSGFEGLLGGYIFSTGTPMQLNEFGYFWTSSNYDDSRAWFRGLGANFPTVRKFYNSKDYPHSVRCIKGEGAANLPPTTPSNPIPSDGALKQLIGLSLQWSSTDPENDPLTFDVYFGTSANPPLLQSGISGVTFNPGTLAYVTTYFWKVIAHDTQGNTAEGPVWSFTTKSQGGIFKCGDVVTDPRNGETYSTVLIGDQCWMAENLNVGTRIDASTQMSNNSIIEKYCYDNDPANCDVYGGLYQWDEMMQYSTTQGAKGICMDGWRLPTDNEWKTLEGNTDSEFPVDDPEWDNWSWRGSDVAGNLKEIGTSHWQMPNNGATNSSGFTALGSGYGAGSSFTSLKQMNMFWTSTQLTGANAIMRGMHFALASNMRSDYTKALAISVRCIQSNQAPNEPPATPSNPNPQNGSTGQSLESTLQWTCTDPDGDPLTYDVYFGSQANPSLVASGISEKTFNPGTLNYFTQYFWKIVAHDDHGNTKEGPVWNFTTTKLFFSVTFNVVDENQSALTNAVITLNGVTNAVGNYLFNEVPAGTFDYSVQKDGYISTYGQVTVVDQSVTVTVTLPVLVIVDEFPFVEDFSGGVLPQGWRNTIQAGTFGWEFSLAPVPHAFIHNTNRPAVGASLITPMLNATNIGQVTLGINQRFLTNLPGGTISITISENGQTWQTIAQYTTSIGTGNFEYIEYDITNLASGKNVFITLKADFPNTDANYEASWEVENLTVFEPGYSVSFEVTNTAGVEINDAVILLDGEANPAGNYLFDNMVAGTYQYIVKAGGYIDTYGFITLNDQNITEPVILRQAITINEFPYTQYFNENILPEGWNNITLGDPDGYWHFAEGQAQIQSSWGNRTHALLVSPAFDCSNLETVAIGLNYYYTDIFSVGFAEIVLSTDGETWTTIEHFQGETVGSMDFPYFEYYVTEYAAGEPTVYIGLLYDDLASTEFWWLVDTFTIFEPAPYMVSVENISGNKYVNAGESVTFEFEIVNRGGQNDTYALEVLNATWQYELSQQDITINAGQKSTVMATMHVPSEAGMGEKNIASLKVNSQGQSSLSEIATFTTVAVSTIKNNYFENFDLAIRPDLPLGWSKVQQSTSSQSAVKTVIPSMKPVSEPQILDIYAGDDLNPTLILVSPKFDDSRSVNEFRVVFWLRASSENTLRVGTMSSPTGQFTELGTFSTENHFTWEQKMFSFENYQGSDKYIAFKLKNVKGNSGLNLDDISIEIIPPPILATTPDSWDFGEYWVRYPSEIPLEIDVKNIGHDFLKVNSIYFDNPDDFLLDFDRTMLGAKLYWNDNIPLTVHFNAAGVGPRSGNIVIEYNDGQSKTKYIPLQGVGLERPIGSTCDNPIYLELPLVEYENTTQFAGNDYDNFSVFPSVSLLRGYDMDFRFTLEEESYLNGSISGPYYGPSLYITSRCPDKDNPPSLIVGVEGVYGGSFEDVILPAGEYSLTVSSPKQTGSYVGYSPFVLNLVATPTPDLHSVTFNLYEDSPEQSPVADAKISITGFQTNLSLKTGMNGQVKRDLYEYEYHVYIYKQDYAVHDFIFHPTSDTIVDIAMNDLIWTPHGLDVQTAGLYPGQAHFTWIEKPGGEPWTEGFEQNYPPTGWDTIVTNRGQVEVPGYDWKFTWQKYGVVNFSNESVAPFDGSYQAFVHWDVYPQDEWLITHQFEAPAGALEFWYYGTNGLPPGYGYYRVNVSTDDGETWMTIWQSNDLPYGRNHYDYPAVVDLQPFAGQNIRLAWQAEGEHGLSGAWLIDKITVGNIRIDEAELIQISKLAKEPESLVHGTIPSTREEFNAPPVKFEDMNYNLSGTRTNKGFSVYLDDMVNPVAQGIQEPEFLFIGLDAGDYIAGVQAVTTTGQSEIVTIPFNNPTSGIGYIARFVVRNELGVGLSGAQIKISYAGNVIKTLQSLNGNATTTLYPGDYDFTISKDGYKTFNGEFSVTNAAQYINAVLEEGYSVQFVVKNNSNQPIAGATVFCDGTAKITSAEGTATFEVIPGSYPYSVTHPLYDRVLSSLEVGQAGIIQNVMMPDLTCETPDNLTAQIINSTAALSWEKPTIGNDGTWIHWDREFGNNAIGTGSAIDFDVAQRFDVVDIQPYGRKFLTRIWFYPYVSTCDYSVRVWTGGDISGPQNLVVDQHVSNPVIGQWNEVFLITPVPIDGTKELWFGLRCNTSSGHPASVDMGPAENGKGNMIRFSGDWQTLLSLNPDLNYNWSIRGLVEAMDWRSQELTALPDDNSGNSSGVLSITNNLPDRSLYSPRMLLGYNVYRNDLRINNELVPYNGYTDMNLLLGEASYNVTSVWSNGCESEYSNTAIIINACQQLTFAKGWNGVSAFVVPENPNPESLFSPVSADLIFMQNLSGFYWPTQGINTMGDFDNNSGYALKFSRACNMEICGNQFADRQIQLTAEWHYLPVLSECEVSVLNLFAGVIDNIEIVQELIGTRVYWPEMNVYSLENLVPGKAYKIKVRNPITLTFPDCNGKTSAAKSYSSESMNSIWGTVNPTPFAQHIAFSISGNDQIEAEDVIGVYGQNDEFYGFHQIGKADANFAITVFGDDLTTGFQDGFVENELLSFQLFRASTGEYFEMEVSFDPSYGNATGSYQSNTLSRVDDFRLKATGINPAEAMNFQLYPNPASGKITVFMPTSEGTAGTIEIFNIKGEIVLSQKLSGKQTIDVSNLSPGIYMVRGYADSFNSFRKLVIR